MNRVANRGGITLLLVLLLLAGFVFFTAEFVSNAPQWVVHPGSPHVYNGTNIDCGTVLDAEGKVIVDLSNGRSYSSVAGIRKTMVHWVGDREGRVYAPALSAYSAQIAGYDLVNGLYRYGGQGNAATLSLSSTVQIAALEAMGGKRGAVAVYNYKTGALLCALTTPCFDPVFAPEPETAEEGLYYNRFTQSVYIPGSIFKIVTLAAALEEGGFEDKSYYCDGSYTVGGDKIICAGVHGYQDLQTAFRNSCNCAFAQVAEVLGAEKLEAYVDAFGVVESVTFDGVQTSPGSYDLTDAATSEVAWSAIGQYKDQINPCVFLNFVGAIAGEGKGVVPYLVEEIGSGAAVSYRASTTAGERIMSPRTAQKISEYMRSNVSDKYGDGYFPGLTVCAKTGTGEVDGGKRPNATLAGFCLDEKYPLAFVVFVEDGGFGGDACLPVASKVLAASKTLIDTYGT